MKILLKLLPVLLGALKLPIIMDIIERLIACLLNKYLDKILKSNSLADHSAHVSKVALHLAELSKMVGEIAEDGVIEPEEVGVVHKYIDNSIVNPRKKVIEKWSKGEKVGAIDEEQVGLKHNVS